MEYKKNVIHIYYLCKENLYPKMRRVLILGRKSYKIYFPSFPLNDLTIT